MAFWNARKDPAPSGGGHMHDGPDMMQRLADQAPYLGTWRSAGERIVMTLSPRSPGEPSRMQLQTRAEPPFAADLWVHASGYTAITRNSRAIPLPAPYESLRFIRRDDAFCLALTDGQLFMLARPGREIPPTPPERALQEEKERAHRQREAIASGKWRCRSCKTENSGRFCTECGMPRPAPCPRCGWQLLDGSASMFCPQCGQFLK